MATRPFLCAPLLRYMFEMLGLRATLQLRATCKAMRLDTWRQPVVEFDETLIRRIFAEKCNVPVFRHLTHVRELRFDLDDMYLKGDVGPGVLQPLRTHLERVQHLAMRAGRVDVFDPVLPWNLTSLNLEMTCDADMMRRLIACKIGRTLERLVLRGMYMGIGDFGLVIDLLAQSTTWRHVELRTYNFAPYYSVIPYAGDEFWKSIMGPCLEYVQLELHIIDMPPDVFWRETLNLVHLHIDATDIGISPKDVCDTITRAPCAKTLQVLDIEKWTKKWDNAWDDIGNDVLAAMPKLRDCPPLLPRTLRNDVFWRI